MYTTTTHDQRPDHRVAETSPTGTNVVHASATNMRRALTRTTGAPFASAFAASLATRRPPRRDRGQATTEYALVMLGAALVAVLLIGWATAGGGAAAIGRLFDRAINSVIDQL